MTPEGRGPRMIPSPNTLRGLDEFYGPIEEQDVDVWDTIRIRRSWIDEWRGAIANDYDVAIMVTGPVGTGKSTCSIGVAAEIDPTLTADTMPDHVAFTAEEFMTNIEKAHRGQAIVFDEAVRGMLSSDTFAADQKALTTALALVRAKNLVLILCVPDPFQIAKNFRARRAGWWIACLDRGVGLVHVRDNSIKYESDQKMGLYKDPVRNPFVWEPLEGTRLWAAYMKVKMDRIAEYLREAQEEMQVRKDRALGKRRSQKKRQHDDDDPDEAAPLQSQSKGRPRDDDQAETVK